MRVNARAHLWVTPKHWARGPLCRPDPVLMCEAAAFSRLTVTSLVPCGGRKIVMKNHCFSSSLKTRGLYLGTEIPNLVKIQISGPRIPRGAAGTPPAILQTFHPGEASPGGLLPRTSKNLHTLNLF